MRGASEGEGLGNKFLANIREADAICQVVRAFEDGDVVHVDGKVSPSVDIETIHTELILADLQTLEKAVPRLEKEVADQEGPQGRRSTTPLAAQKVLEEGHTLYAAGAAAGVDLALASRLGLLTTKPFIYVFNLDEEQLADADLHARLGGARRAGRRGLPQRQARDGPHGDGPDEDALEMLQSFGAEESGLDQLARIGFHTLGLQTYLTAGPKESRAWTIRKGWTAPQAAGVIHTDFQRGFIKAEIVSFDDLDRRRARWPPPRPPARCAWRARSTSCRTATSWSSASTSEKRPSPQVSDLRDLPVGHRWGTCGPGTVDRSTGPVLGVGHQVAVGGAPSGDARQSAS